jgi:hypothetical protein
MTYTKETLEKFEGRDEWKGFGYLGGFGWRSQETDEILIAAANEAGITEEEFFQFCNSKPGRKLDQIFEGKWEDGVDRILDPREFTSYWPVRVCDDAGCSIWHSTDSGDACEDCGSSTTAHGPHKDLHGELVKFLPEVCSDLMEEIAINVNDFPNRGIR